MNEEMKKKISDLAKKRDYCTDVLGKPLLGWTYQDEIDRIISAHKMAKGEL